MGVVVESERRIVSVLFCDLAGFTPLSEQLDVEDVATVQDAYFTAVKDAVARHGGTLEKFIGDAAVAVFGAPTAAERDAESAVRCGLAIAAAVEQLAARIGLEGSALDVRIGVNTGEAVVHPDPAPGEALVTGDVVNTAARLQTAAPLNAVLVGPETALAVAAAVELEPAGELELKGKSEPVRAFRAVAALEEPERERAMGALRAPTIGREAELARLLAILDECSVGQARRLTLVAPPGTGKTRLVEELAALAAARGAAVRRARLRPDALSPFRPVAELVLATLEDVGVDPSGESDLRAALAATLGPERAAVVTDEVRELLGGAEGGTASGANARRAARFGAWSDAMRALGTGVEIWLVEDVHWSDPDLRSFLESAVTDDSRGRLVLATSRPTLAEADLGWLARGDVLELEPLSHASTSALVEALVGGALPDNLVNGIGERSGGNPLFVEELLRSWVSTGLLERNGNGWRLVRPVSGIGLPTTVQAVYAAQLDELPPGARSLLRRASVAGRQFAVEAVAALDGGGVDEVEALARRGIVHGPVADPMLGTSFVFRHALLRDAGYASLARGERARLHVRMARWLEGRSEARADGLAAVTGRHFAAALDSTPLLAADVGDGLSRDEAADRAAHWFERGAAADLRLGANDSARALFARALELTPPAPSLERGRRLLGLARSTAFTSDMEEGLLAAEQALACFRELFDAGPSHLVGEAREEASRAVALVGEIYAQQLRFHDVVSLAADALVELGDRSDAVTARLLLTGVRGAGMIGDEAWDGAREDRERALEIALALGDLELELDARRWTVNDAEDWRAGWSEVDALATRLRRWGTVADARISLTSMALPDELDEALAAAARLESFARAHELDESAAWADYYRSEIGFARGDWDAALEAGLRAASLGEERAYHRVAVRSWHVVVPMAGARGDRATLERIGRWFEDMADVLPDTPYARITRTAIAVVLGRSGVGPPRRPDLPRLEESILDASHLPSWFDQVDVVVEEAVALGEVHAAAAAVATFSRAHPSESGPTVVATRRLLDARLAAARGDLDAVRVRVGELRPLDRPWPLLKGLRLLQAADRALLDELSEIRVLEDRLGLGDRSTLSAR